MLCMVSHMVSIGFKQDLQILHPRKTMRTSVKIIKCSAGWNPTSQQSGTIAMFLYTQLKHPWFPFKAYLETWTMRIRPSCVIITSIIAADLFALSEVLALYLNPHIQK